MLDISPAWTPSLADGGVIAPLDDYIAKYMNMADLDDYHPLYKALPTYKGKIWGFFDDGDMFALYYRKDIFEDPKLKEAYQAKFSKALEVPKTWEDYAQVAQFITDQHGAERLWRRAFPQGGQPGQPVRLPAAVPRQWRHVLRRRHEGAARLRCRRQDARRTCWPPTRPRSPATTSSMRSSLWAAWLQGKVAMIYSWPPTGRMTAGYSQSDKAINFVPQSTIADKVGYAVVPGNPEHATGYNKALSADSANPEAAYLFMQWACSPPVSLARCMLPYALRDPYRISHFKSELYGALFPTAKEYLRNLNNSANVGLLDPIMPGAQDYFLSIDRMCTAVWAGADPMASLQTAAAEWDATTERLGVEFAEGVLHGVPEAARRHRRQYRRETRHGRHALTDRD